MRITRWSRPLLTAVGVSLLLLACYPESLLPPERNPGAPTAPNTRPSVVAAATETAPATLAPLATPQDIRTGVDALTRALQASDAQTLSHLLLGQVWLAQGPNGDNGQAITRDDAVTWLNARWGKQRTVVSSDYIEHFVLLEITTSGWVARAPMHSSVIILHLHRYNAQEQADPLQGAWRIDTILYQ